MHVLVEISEVCATQRTASRVQSHLHKLRGSLLVLAVAGRRDEIRDEKVVDVALGTIFVEGALGLIHQLLHDLRKVTIR